MTHSYRRLRSETEGRGGNQPNLNGLILRRLLVPLPPLPEQKRIAAILSEQLEGAGRIVESLEAECAAINRMSAALLRRAFSGEV